MGRLTDRVTWTCAASYNYHYDEEGLSEEQKAYAPLTVSATLRTPHGTMHSAQARLQGRPSAIQQAEMLIRSLVRENYPTAGKPILRGGYPEDYFVTFQLDPEDAQKENTQPCM